MGSRHADQSIDKAAPHLERGERVEMTAFVTIGSVSIRRELARSLAIGAVAAVATGGTFITMRRPRKAYLAMTNQRLMFFDVETFLGKPGKLLFTLPKQAAQVVGSGKFGVGLLRVELAIEGQAQGLRVNFAPGSRETGYKVVASLGAAAQGARRPRQAREEYPPRADWRDQRPAPNWDGRGPQHIRDARRPQKWDGRQAAQPWGDPQPRSDWGGQWPQEWNGQPPTSYR